MSDFINAVEVKIKEIITTQLGCATERITSELSFENDLGADELDMITIIMDVEGKFNIEIPDTAASQIFTVGDLIKYIQGRLEKK